MTVTLPAELAADIADLFGDRGREWVAALPALVDSLCRRWDLTVAGPALRGGTHSYVAPVRHRADPDTPRLVLKVPVLDDENYAEAAALRCYGGDGAVRLHRVDLDSGALLLERADPGHALLADYENGRLPLSTVVDTAAGLLGRLSRPPSGDLSCPAPRPPAEEGFISAPPGTAEQPFPLVRDLALRWSRELPGEHDKLGRPYDHRLFTEAAALCAELAAPDGPPVIVNRDGHTGNILAAHRRHGGPRGEPWLLIDPKPMLGDAAFDAGHLIWDLLRYRLTVSRARYLVDRVAEGMGVDRARVRAWALVRAVDNISWAHPEGEAQPYVDAATVLAAVR